MAEIHFSPWQALVDARAFQPLRRRKLGAVVKGNVVDGFLKRYPNFRPTVALYPWKCENSVLQYNEVYNGPSTNADGSPYDMDSALKNVVYQFNYSHNNPCG